MRDNDEIYRESDGGEWIMGTMGSVPADTGKGVQVSGLTVDGDILPDAISADDPQWEPTDVPNVYHRMRDDRDALLAERLRALDLLKTLTKPVTWNTVMELSRIEDDTERESAWANYLDQRAHIETVADTGDLQATEDAMAEVDTAIRAERGWYTSPSFEGPWTPITPPADRTDEPGLPDTLTERVQIDPYGQGQEGQDPIRP